MTNKAPAGCCPQCRGIQGYSCELVLTRPLGGTWGGAPAPTGKDAQVRTGFVTCLDCGHRFRRSALVASGLLPEQLPELSLAHA